MRSFNSIDECLAFGEVKIVESDFVKKLHSHCVHLVDVGGVRCIYKLGTPSQSAVDVQEWSLHKEGICWDPFYKGKHYLKEELVYLMCKEMEWDIVPPTATRLDIYGSVQLFIEGETLQENSGKRFDRNALINTPDGAQMAVLDFLTNQKDRSWKNIMVTPSNRLIAIDNELAFEPKVITDKMYSQYVEPSYVWELLDSRAVGWWFRQQDQKLVKIALNDVLELSELIVSLVKHGLESHEVLHSKQLLEEMCIRYDLLAKHGFVEAVKLWYKYAFQNIPFKRRLTRHV